ncbi:MULTISPECIES: Rossmann-like and DUF2520 domain-containing protein [Microbulbifer]|uniref:Rossmann-like and DUF2520 domain-containing protein n=1 Tax=Microbulbifer TaxID=48073 RepID=UPI001E286442|nr:MULTISPECIES: Rossmann-like and DUF2520 domain-containing protein [Microbulbifer]UHQ55086.1 DUF2520 domain-containing protein [Microbulbifer sp. YPW16]
MQTLNIVGAGNLGRTLGRLWQQQGFFRVRAVCNRSPSSSEAAAFFIGAGAAGEIPEAFSTIEAMPAADCWLVATGDSQIAAVARELGASGRARNTVVFHCSGALDATTLTPCRPAALASAHPVHSFADPARSLQTLGGSTVALEGDESALALLREAFIALDCQPLSLAGADKSLYHAASVLGCNYLTALLDLSLRAYEQAGIDRQRALEMLGPIATQTLANNLRLGPEAALTGPIARGDIDTVQSHLDALPATDPVLQQCYRQLGRACVELARRRELDRDTANQLEQLLSEQGP